MKADSVSAATAKSALRALRSEAAIDSTEMGSSFVVLRVLTSAFLEADQARSLHKPNFEIDRMIELWSIGAHSRSPAWEQVLRSYRLCVSAVEAASPETVLDVVDWRLLQLACAEAFASQPVEARLAVHIHSLGLRRENDWARWPARRKQSLMRQIIADAAAVISQANALNPPQVGLDAAEPGDAPASARRAA